MAGVETLGFVFFSLFLSIVSFGVAFFMFRGKKSAVEQVDSFQDFINSLHKGLVFFDREGRFIQANFRAKQIIPEIEAEDSDLLTLQSFLGYLFDHAVEGDEYVNLALEKLALQKKDAQFLEVIKVENNLVCLAEAQNTPAGQTVFILSDIDYIREQEEKLVQLNYSNFRLFQAVDAATNGIVILLRSDDFFIVQFANSSFCESLGLARDNVLGEDFFSLLSNVKEEKRLKIFKQKFLSSQALDIELVLTRDREVRHYDFKLTAVPHEEGGENLYVAVLTDTTALKSRETRLFSAQKLEALGRVSAGVAHDFNNLLSIIDGYTRLAAKNVEDKDAETFGHLERIRAASQRGANLTRQMLTFGRHKIVKNEVIDLVEAVQGHEALLKPLVRGGVSYVFVCEESHIHVETNADAVMQILMNLVVNASDAIESRGEILVRIEKLEPAGLPESALQKFEGRDQSLKQGLAALSVSDTGSGIKADVLDKIFDPFFTTKEQGKGTGLGLAMVYGLVQQMNGVIDVQSQVGAGSVFSVYLPISEQELSKQVLGDRDDPLSIRLHGYSILVVEDEPDLLVLLKQMLEQAGMEVLTAQDGNEALVVQDDYEGKIDILLTDIVMPDLGGVELAEMFEALRPETRVVFMSGYPAEGNLSEFNIPQDAFFMAKPLRYENLVAMVSSLLDPESNHDFVRNALGFWVFEGGLKTEEQEGVV